MEIRKFYFLYRGILGILILCLVIKACAIKRNSSARKDSSTNRLKQLLKVDWKHLKNKPGYRLITFPPQIRSQFNLIFNHSQFNSRFSTLFCCVLVSRTEPHLRFVCTFYSCKNALRVKSWFTKLLWIVTRNAMQPKLRSLVARYVSHQSGTKRYTILRLILR